jgi:hypothetical protein
MSLNKLTKIIVTPTIPFDGEVFELFPQQLIDGRKTTPLPQFIKAVFTEPKSRCDCSLCVFRDINCDPITARLACRSLTAHICYFIECTEQGEEK